LPVVVVISQHLLNVFVQLANKRGFKKKLLRVFVATGTCLLTRCVAAFFFIFFLDFPIYMQSVEIHSDTFSKLCVGKRGRVEECSVAPLRNKRVKTLCGCRGKKGTNLGKLQTKTYN
jgi:hypothetical protein